jgi:DNA primase catalytic subunit
VIEECLVDELFKLRWRKRRMDQYDQIRLRERAAQLHENNDMSRHRMNLKRFASRPKMVSLS